MNEVRLIGNLTKDVTVVTVGKKNVTKAIACIALDSGQQTNFPLCVAWGEIGKKFAELKKGDCVKIFGSIATNSYEKKDGQKVYSTYVNVINFARVERNPIEVGLLPF